MNALDIVDRVEMDDLRGIESGISFSGNNDNARAVVADNPVIIPNLRRKPGSNKIKKLRSEKISCRLSKEEKEAGELYCNQYGISEAKLMRASYLAAILQPPDDGFKRLVDQLLPLDDENLSESRKTAIRLKAKHILKRSSAALLLILLGCAMAPIINKGFLYFYETGKEWIFDDHTKCIYHTGTVGCELIKEEWGTPDPEYTKKGRELYRNLHSQ